jgi:hypothetical protein
MTFETETVLDRRRLRRRVSWWRALAIIAAVVVVGVVSAKTAEQAGFSEKPAHRPRQPRRPDHRGSRAAEAAARYRREQAGSPA